MYPEFNAAEHTTSLKQVSKYTTVDNVDDNEELHILPTDVKLTGPHFAEKAEPTRPSNLEEEVDQSRMHQFPRSPPEYSLLRRVTTKP